MRQTTPGGSVVLMTSLFAAKVEGGAIVAEDVDLPEGVTVTVMGDEPADDCVELTADDEAELAAAIAAASHTQC